MKHDAPDQLECKKQFLIDCPALEDKFSSGGHEKAAHALAEWLKDGQGANAIALEGGLGSGKSSIVDMAEDELKPIDKHWFFKFDLFLHKHDSVRRAFLESLIKFIKERTELSEHEHKRLDEIHKKVTNKVTSIKKSQRIHLQFSAVLLAMAFAITIAIIGGLAQGLLSVAEPDTTFLGFLSLIAAGLPLLIILCFWLYQCHLDRKAKKESKKKREWSWSQLVVRDTGGTFTDEYLTAPEITEIEMAEFFKELLELIPAKRTLTIVLDNIDRIPPDEVLSTWRNLDIFIGEAKTQNDIMEGGVRVIVPYDASRLTEAFQKTFTIDDVSEARRLTIEYINKRFPIRIPVPKILITEWRDFLEDCWTICSGCATDPQTMKDITTIYDQLREATEITPRQIQQFCNDLRVVSEIDKERNPIICALYTLCVLYKGLEIDSLLEEDDELAETAGVTPLARKTLESVSIDWRQKVAALHFNTTEDKAIALLLDSKLIQAIRRKQKEAYDNLFGKHGFEEALIRTLEIISANSSASEDFESFIALQATNEEDISAPTREHIWRIYSPVIDNMGCWPTPKKQLPNMKILFPEHFHQIGKELLKRFCSKPSKEEKTESWLASINHVFKHADDTVARPQITISGDDLFNEYLTSEESYESLTLEDFKEEARSSFVEQYGDFLLAKTKSFNGIENIDSNLFWDLKRLLVVGGSDASNNTKTGSYSSLVEAAWTRINRQFNAQQAQQNYDISLNEIATIALADDGSQNIASAPHVNLVPTLLRQGNTDLNFFYWLLLMARSNRFSAVESKDTAFIDFHNEVLQRISGARILDDWLEVFTVLEPANKLVGAYINAKKNNAPYLQYFVKILDQLITKHSCRLNINKLIEHYDTWIEIAQAANISREDLWKWLNRWSSSILKFDLDAPMQFLKNSWEYNLNSHQTIIDLLETFFTSDADSDDEYYERWVDASAGPRRMLLKAEGQLPKVKHKKLLKATIKYAGEVLDGNQVPSDEFKSYFHASLGIVDGRGGLNPELNKLSKRILAKGGDEENLGNCEEVAWLLEETLPIIECDTQEQAQHLIEFLSSINTSESTLDNLTSWLSRSASSIEQAPWKEFPTKRESLEEMLQAIADGSLEEESLKTLAPLWEQFKLKPKKRKQEATSPEEE